jgi:hypothetical protein
MRLHVALAGQTASTSPLYVARPSMSQPIEVCRCSVGQIASHEPRAGYQQRCSCVWSARDTPPLRFRKQVLLPACALWQLTRSPKE